MMTHPIYDELVARLYAVEPRDRHSARWVMNKGHYREQADALLISRFKPDTVRARARRALAECEAKRRIVARLQYRLSMQAETATEPLDWDDLTRHYYETCRDLAAPYTDHPEYDSRWAVSGG